MFLKFNFSEYKPETKPPDAPNASCNSQRNVPRCQGAVGNQWDLASVKGKGALCATALLFSKRHEFWMEMEKP